MKSGFAAIRKWFRTLMTSIGFDSFKDWLSKTVSSFKQRWKGEPTKEKPTGKELFTETLVLGSKLTEYSGGDCAIRFFNKTTKGQHIVITHFGSEDVMSPEYLASQKSALERGVHVKRIVATKYKDRIPPEFLEWEKAYPSQYALHFYPGNRPLPMDFAVRDDNAEVLFVLPPHPEMPFSVALTLHDPMLVQAFRAMFTTLVLDAPLLDSDDKLVNTA